MLNYKSLLSYLLVLAMSFAITACDDCDDEEGGAEAAGEEAKADAGEESEEEGGEECPEAGTDGGSAEAGTAEAGTAEAGTEEASYNYLVLVDDGDMGDTVGTSGADIYGLAVSCDDGAATLSYDSQSFGASAQGASCTAGTDCVCTVAVEGNCGGTNRGDTNNILSGGDDAYYSMGNGGYVIFSADKSLDSCSATWKEKGDDEDAVAYACTSKETNPAMAGDECAQISE